MKALECTGSIDLLLNNLKISLQNEQKEGKLTQEKYDSLLKQLKKETIKVNLTGTSFEKGLINFKKSPKDRINYNYVDARLEILESQFKNFTAKYEALVGEYESEELYKCFQEDVYEKVYETYLTYKVELKNALSQVKVNSSNKEVCAGSSDSVVRLPKIVLPTFSGKYTEWSSFRDLFISLVHNIKNLMTYNVSIICKLNCRMRQNSL
ncbi:unnamed protein product [Euphydryas editha]|uniref:Uncharacterized protein n=1 Tax=Euphydryas editha TaxID=104508 RepID=A0AAU9TW52_EUPED|nr:unnamed protein product [Euphydryas editha]